MIRYKKNKNISYQNNLIASSRKEPEEKPKGPFQNCMGCPYTSHGFICYRVEGDCMRSFLTKDKEK